MERSTSGPSGSATTFGLFLAGAISMYAGAVLAVELFDEVDPVAVAWLRSVAAAVTLLLFVRRPRPRWSRSQFVLVAAFGVATAAMNTAFYLAIDRLPLGTAVAIEFLGPITVAAVATRTARAFVALGLGATGVVLVSGPQLDGSASGVVFALVAAACWAAYIVLGAPVARLGRGAWGVALAMSVAAVALVPVGAPHAGPAFSSASVLLGCLAVGVLSNAVPYGIDQLVLRRVREGAFALMLALLPVTAAVMGAAALEQELAAAEVGGIGLVVVAIVLRRPDRDSPLSAEVP